MLLTVFMCIVSIPTVLALSATSRVAFYYGAQWPVNELNAFEVVVVSPHANIKPSTYNTAHSELFAYVSIGEVSADAAYAKKVSPSWRAGHNTAWNSHVMNLADEHWQHFVIESLIRPLWAQGYRGFFFDTLDSYQLSHRPKTEQEQGLVTLVLRIKHEFPDAKLIFNRGFEVLPKLHPYVSAVAAESLYDGWNARAQRYGLVPASERQWLLKQLHIVKNRYHLPVIVIDYQPATERAKARATAKRIQAHGFIPWVGNASLTNIGVGQIEVFPRRVLVLYNKEKGADTLIEQNYLPAAFPLQYMGYIPELHAIDDDLPSEFVEGAYAGMIVQFNEQRYKNTKSLEAFLSKSIDAGIPLVILNYLGFPEHSPLLKRLGIALTATRYPIGDIRLIKGSPMLNYELTIAPNILNFYPLQLTKGEVLAQVEASNHQLQTAAAITPWGGLALRPYSYTGLPDGQNRWIINPFAFFQKALRLADIPVPDVTTSNGRRIFMSQIDGDLYTAPLPWDRTRFAGEVMLNEILKPFALPITISFIQREFELLQNDPPRYQRAVDIARQSAALPWVRLATHTYSHPLQWEKLVPGQPNTAWLSYPSPGYLFSYTKEVGGSAHFIDRYIAPKGKAVDLILWSGDGMVGEQALKAAADAHLYNLNGMASVYLKGSESLTNLSALGREDGPYYQVFSPIANDFVYTNSWTPPLYQFQNVVETFALTDKPKRYKPISVYYHFYSAIDQAAMRALKNIYQWVSEQSITPIFNTDYVQKVLAFNHTVIGKTLQGEWFVAHNGALKELRVSVKKKPMDTSKTTNVMGYNDIDQARYVHLGEGAMSLIRETTKPIPFLVDANADTLRWTRHDAHRITLEFQGIVPFEFRLSDVSCRAYFKRKRLAMSANHSYHLKDTTHGAIQIQCP